MLGLCDLDVELFKSGLDMVSGDQGRVKYAKDEVEAHQNAAVRLPKHGPRVELATHFQVRSDETRDAVARPACGLRASDIFEEHSGMEELDELSARLPL